MRAVQRQRATDIANRVDFVARVRDVVDFGEQRELVDGLGACGACMGRALANGGTLGRLLGWAWRRGHSYIHALEHFVNFFGRQGALSWWGQGGEVRIRLGNGEWRCGDGGGGVCVWGGCSPDLELLSVEDLHFDRVPSLKCRARTLVGHTCARPQTKS